MEPWYYTEHVMCISGKNEVIKPIISSHPHPQHPLPLHTKPSLHPKPTTMPSLPATTISLFGLTSLLLGLTNTLHPTRSLATFALPTAALPALKASNCAAIAVGIYYLLAAWQENRAFFVLTVPMRLFTAGVFWGASKGNGAWRAASVWEGGGAVLTGCALGVEMWQRGKKVGKEKGP